MIKQSLPSDASNLVNSQPKAIGWHLLPTKNVGISRRHLASKLSEIILGGQDGLVNVAGVILGLAAATSDTRIIIAGGLAATFAESISMAAVAYTSTLADMDYYRAEVARETNEIRHSPAGKRLQVAEVFTSWGFSGQLLEDAIDHITQDEKHWVEIVMAHELELQPVAETGVLTDAILVGLSAIVGSLVPLMPFFFMPPAIAVWLGMVLTAMVLFGVGAVKARLTVGQPGRSGLQMAVIGMVAALAGYAIGALFSR
ncbi:MAG: VIT1/CCC1 transporter family protein [Candidatus Promineifilaceae bacterium]